MAVGGLPGGSVDPHRGGTIRPPVGGQTAARPAGQAPPGIADGSVVEGLVTAKDGDAYTVRIGSQSFLARSTVPLFVGQRFRAVWDAGSTPPTLRLQQNDMAVLSRFSGRDRQIAAMLLSRGLPVNDGVMLTVRQFWMQSGADPAKLGTLAELWARGLPMTEANVVLLSQYMELSPGAALAIWRRIRERLHARKYASPGELLAALNEGDDEEVRDFLKAHAMASKPARRGLDPAALLAPAWWPVDDSDDAPMMARVSFAGEEFKGRQVWWLNFELEGEALGDMLGDVMTNGRSLSVNVRMKDASKVEVVRRSLPALREELAEVALLLQHLGVGALRDGDEAARSAVFGLDMEF